MALPAALVMEVRPTAGTATAGGGFVPGGGGTDWSQQNSPQYSLTNGVTNGTTTIATTSASADMVNNLVYVAGGTGSVAANWYQIISQVTGVSITVDRSTGLTAGTGVTLNIGGAFSTVALAVAIAVPSNTIYVKATGTYTVTTALVVTLQSNASPGVPFSINGYTSTRGDAGQFTWTTATNSIDLIDLGTGSSTIPINVLFQNISFTTTAGTKGSAIYSKATSADSVNVSVINCTVNGFVVGIEGNPVVDGAILGLQLINSRVTGCSSHGVRNGALTYVLGCMLDNNGGDGFNASTAPFPTGVYAMVFENSIFYKNSANGINIANDNTPSATLNQLIVISHCAVSTNTNAGVLTEASTCPYLQVSNSIFDANGTYGMSNGVGGTGWFTGALLYNNAFYNNGTAPTVGFNAGIGTVTLSANPYTSIGSDFSLNSTAGGGAACKGAGWPGALNFGGTGHADIGPLQASGAVTTTVNVIAPTQIRNLVYEGE